MGLLEWRRDLDRRLVEFARVVRALDTRHPQICASLYRHRIRCGRPRCHCADGPGHERWCLSFESSRGRHTRTLSEEELRQVMPGAEAYRRFRQTRAQAARVFRSILTLIDRIQKSLAKSPRPPPGEP
jgi:hypothetical protein